MEHLNLLIVVALVNIPVYFLLGKLYFGNWEEFLECVRYSFTPDIISMFRGEYWRDYFKSFKLSIFLLLCGGMVYLEFYGLVKALF